MWRRRACGASISACPAAATTGARCTTRSTRSSPYYEFTLKKLVSRADLQHCRVPADSGRHGATEPDTAGSAFGLRRVASHSAARVSSRMRRADLSATGITGLHVPHVLQQLHLLRGTCCACVTPVDPPPKTSRRANRTMWTSATTRSNSHASRPSSTRGCGSQTTVQVPSPRSMLAPTKRWHGTTVLAVLFPARLSIVSGMCGSSAVARTR
jgi:hypothetical protein